jgi:hypothetical protein
MLGLEKDHNSSLSHSLSLFSVIMVIFLVTHRDNEY